MVFYVCRNDFLKLNALTLNSGAYLLILNLNKGLQKTWGTGFLLGVGSLPIYYN